MNIGGKAAIPNAALKPFAGLVGQWQTTGTHPYFPDAVLHGRASFELIENGAFLLMRSEVDHPQFPEGISIFGSDDAEEKFYLLYFDSRGVSRKYDVTVAGNTFTWQREDPALSQRMIFTIESGGNTVTSRGEMSRNGGEWESDLSQTFSRIE